jgi:Fe2+ transport system protein FeoA
LFAAKFATLAAAQLRQRLQKFGIKPDGIINLLAERASAQTQAQLC